MPITNHQDILDGPKYYLGANPYPMKSVDDWSHDVQGSSIIPFGFAVVQGTADGVTLPVNASSVFSGFAVATETIEKRDGYSIDPNGFWGYPLQHRMTVRKNGPIVAHTVQAVAEGDPVFFIHTPRAGQRAGMVRRDLDTDRALRAGRYVFAKAAQANTNVPIHQI